MSIIRRDKAKEFGKINNGKNTVYLINLIKQVNQLEVQKIASSGNK